MEKNIGILPDGVEGEPLFPTPEDYERFCERYREKVVPELEKCELARARSWHEAQTRFVD